MNYLEVKGNLLYNRKGMAQNFCQLSPSLPCKGGMLYPRYHSFWFRMLVSSVFVLKY